MVTGRLHDRMKSLVLMREKGLLSLGSVEEVTTAALKVQHVMFWGTLMRSWKLIGHGLQTEDSELG